MFGKYAIILVIILFPFAVFSQQQEVKVTKTKKGLFYGAWGYNKDYFSRSDLHFHNQGSDHYDFVLYDVVAHDRPGYSQILSSTLSIPQYVYRFGYYFNDKHNLGIEINFDHAKYVMDNYQVAHLTGTIHEQTFDKDTLVTPSFLKFEHTNGANFLMLNIIHKHELFASKNDKHHLFTVIKAGGGIVIPKTDVTLFGERLDNVFHIAGYIGGIDGGLRYEFFRHFFSEFTVKGTYANYYNVLTVGTGKANHHFYTGEMIWTIGYQLPL